MLSLLIQKELKNILLSPKFVATFAVCSILILMSIYIGIQEYNNSVIQYEANQEIARQTMSEATSWMSVRNIIHRAPTPMQIFVSETEVLKSEITEKSVVSSQHLAKNRFYFE